ncbi:hypothetical protein GIS00_20905 [Nakamurella sp. YIM 132087]|uniref:Uncharacterized protein n=1 Tax=Nakamurella alba TaxID=2665158 RepID=A0A7K1FQQ1_9ACTN|nr:hypothetical protein [Nakamurella alba]MTD16400.1 hypothetical protein [Nakamurella alba]
MPLPPLDDFLTSAGAGGLGAVIAGVGVVTATMIGNRARKSEGLAEVRHNALERWWSRFTWVVEAKQDDLPLHLRTTIVGQLLLQAQTELMSSELEAAALAYSSHLRSTLRSQQVASALVDPGTGGVS